LLDVGKIGLMTKVKLCHLGELNTLKDGKMERD